MFQQVVLQMQAEIHTSADKILPWRHSELTLRKGKVKTCRTNPGNLLCTWAERKGLLIYLVKKFLAAYPIVLPPSNKAINMERKKKKKKERRCITFMTHFRILMCNQYSIWAPQASRLYILWHHMDPQDISWGVTFSSHGMFSSQKGLSLLVVRGIIFKLILNASSTICECL